MYMGTVPYTFASALLTVKHHIHMESISSWEWSCSTTWTICGSYLPQMSVSLTIMIVLCARCYPLISFRVMMSSKIRANILLNHLPFPYLLLIWMRFGLNSRATGYMFSQYKKHIVGLRGYATNNIMSLVGVLVYHVVECASYLEDSLMHLVHFWERLERSLAQLVLAGLNSCLLKSCQTLHVRAWSYESLV